MTEKHSPLLPCPFCGDPPFVDDDEDGVCCITCANDNCLGVEITCPTREDAAAFWNTRAVNGLPEAIAALELATKHLADIRAFCTDHKKRPCGDPDAECPISMGEWFSREDLAELDRIDAALTKLKG